ncbi:OmpH family outer membrane protein [uncultured Thiothrix sp.]|uniref:OmpH family outer membrane protein n=1 Tax=uncultured Thiothrix sp. TaxID=223185 RepID=UPI002626D11A|nr:OmpH family outer membrane protein [uncultured Thiothrix sp.]HMT92231.1 OmpH family outer membrane protein [Thiolinea sp.]
MLRLALIGLLFTLGMQSARAEDTSLPYRIAVVNVVKVLEQAPQAAAEGKRLESLFAAREAALAQEQLELQRAREALQATGDSLPEAERIQRERELRTLERDYSRKQEDLREEIRFAKDAALEKVQEQVEQAVETVRAEGQIDIVFRESNYIVASARVNLTDKVLAYLQQQFDTQQTPAASSDSKGTGSVSGE